MNGRILVGLVAGLAALMMATVGEASHGGFWRARDVPATNLAMGLDHDAHPVSTATNLLTGEVLSADVMWSGQQFVGPGFNGIMTLKFFDANGNLAHEAMIPVSEDISNVQWVQCPEGTGDPGVNLETLPTYGMTSPGILDLTGVQRNSFCGNFADPNDPFYFKSFSDYDATYLPGVLCAEAAYELHLHVRGIDHG